MKNEELIKNYTANIETITKDDYLPREYNDKSSEYKKNTQNNIHLQRNYLKKYKKDFITYFIKDYLNERKREEYPFGFSISCATVGIVATIGYLLFYHDIYLHDGYNPLVLAIYAGFIILPTIYERVLLPIYKSHKRYNTYLNKIDTKLEIIRNYQREKDIKETKNEDKTLNGVDSFIREIIRDKELLEGLNTHDKTYFRDKLMAIAKEYIELTFKTENKITVPTLKDNKEIERLYKELIEVEQEIDVSHKKEKNIEVLTDTFGDITKLDTSIVELDNTLDSTIKLNRKLKK